MIYGFGRREYLATGYKAELTTGYSWGEFNDAMYLGMSYETGGFRGVGYIMGGFTLGKLHRPQRRHVAPQRRGCRSAVVLQPVPLPAQPIRRFLAFNYTRGGGTAARAATKASGFTRTDGLQASKAHHRHQPHDPQHRNGRFHPLSAAGIPHRRLRIRRLRADRLFAQHLQKRLFTSLGLGVRLRNERLVFNTIQIRLGIAFGKNGLVESEYFRLSNSTRMEQYRYRPTRPEIVEFK